MAPGRERAYNWAAVCIQIGHRTHRRDSTGVLLENAKRNAGTT